jgi:hypothetical protein
MYFSAVLLIILIGIFAGDRLQYLKFVNKETGAYLVFIFGGMVSIYRITEWYFVYRKPHKYKKLE